MFVRTRPKRLPLPAFQLPIWTTQSGRPWLRASRARSAVITLGDQGALLCDPDGCCEHIPSFKTNVVDTTAAGDAFRAALGVGLAYGRPMPEAIRHAGAAGALAASRPGAACHADGRGGPRACRLLPRITQKMPTELIENLDDPRLDPYRSLKSTNRTRWSNQFIAEGLLVVERLLASRFEVVSVVCNRKVERQVAPIVPLDRPLYLLEHELAKQLVGYTFHTGVLACGVRRPGPPLASLFDGVDNTLLAVCPNVNDPENIGAIIRLSAGFGLKGVLLRRRLCRSFFTARAASRWGRPSRCQLSRPTICGPISPGSRANSVSSWRPPFWISRRAFRDSPPQGEMALLFGNEKHGLDQKWVDLCPRKLMIPMAPHADSLNVAVAAGIFFHYLQRKGALES